MKEDFKNKLIELCEERGDEPVKFFADYPVLKMMIPWLSEQNRFTDFKSKDKFCETNWNEFKEASGLKRLDFYLDLPKEFKFSFRDKYPTVSSFIHRKGSNQVSYKYLGQIIKDKYIDYEKV